MRGGEEKRGEGEGEEGEEKGGVPLCKFLECPCKKVSHKFCPYLFQMLTDFQNFFAGALCEKFVVKWLLNMPPQINYVATLPCEIQNV